MRPSVRPGGSSLVRTLQRAQVLLALDRGLLDQTIAEVLNLDRTRIWRLRKRYVEQGLEAALYAQPRSGRPSLRISMSFSRIL